MLARWNEALEVLRPAICRPEVDPDPAPYGDELLPGDVAPIPERDLPAGAPEWMRSLRSWAARRGDDADEKRATVVVAVPRDFRTWTSTRSDRVARAVSGRGDVGLAEDLSPPDLLEA